MPDALPISYQDVLNARENIKGVVKETPAIPSETLSKVTGADIYLKCEFFHFTGSFKERGAVNRFFCLTDEEKKRGVIAASAGNHAQAVAYHAGKLGIPATIVMPVGTPFNKVKKTEEFGANIVLEGETLAEATDAANVIRDREDQIFIHPYDDPLIMAGQGTAAIEFLETFPDLDCLLVPIGGGGLISGIATAAKAIKPNIKVYGVQTESYPAMKAVLEGREVETVFQTIAEGIAVKKPGLLTRKVVKALVDEIIIVPESAIEKAVNLLMEVEKVVVEGAGAVPLAAILDNQERFAGRKAGLVLAGGNIDSRILASCLMRGLARDGRISRFKVTTLDQPGGLAKVINIIARERGSVVDVVHQRSFSPIALKYTELDIVVETKDRQHMERVIKALEAEGFEVQQLNPF